MRTENEVIDYINKLSEESDAEIDIFDMGFRAGLKWVLNKKKDRQCGAAQGRQPAAGNDSYKMDSERRREMGTGCIILKWGTLKGWNVTTGKGLELLKKYCEIGSSMSAMAQRDTPEQKQIICDLIDECDDPKGIYLDWEGEYVSKEEAKKYVMEYGKKKS